MKFGLAVSGLLFSIESKKPQTAMTTNSYTYIASISIGKPSFKKQDSNENKPMNKDLDKNKRMERCMFLTTLLPS